MATSQKDTTPVCDIGILKTKRVDLVEQVVLENVMPSVKPFLPYAQVDAICAERSRSEKIRSLLDVLQRQLNGHEYRAFNAFITSVAGTQPEVFNAVCGREPTVSEADFCIKGVVQEMKATVDSTKHCTDSELDEQIDFQSEYIELSMVDKTKEEQELDSHRGELPHEYSSHLDEVCRHSRNISVWDVLGNEDKPYRHVSVYGRGGIGKSTTFQLLAKQWALGRWAATFTMLFLLQLRFITTQVIAISTVELLQLYGLYDFPDHSDPTPFTSWLKNCTSRILILIDGLDELPGFAERMKNTPRIHDVLQKAHPVDLIINILRGDLLPGCTVISASRPFAGLSQLPADAKVEILGLTSAKVTAFVEHRHPDHVKNIMSVLSKSPILLSVCSITFYCMLITRLLSEGVTVLDEDVATYSRLMAFIVCNYCSRKLTDSSFLMAGASYLPKLAQLAHSGIFELEENKGLGKIVFDEDDLVRANITPQDLENMKKTGIMQLTRRKIGRHESLTAEFFHLSAQELLAVAHFLSRPPFPSPKLKQLFQSGQFNLALQFMFGLHFDRENSWIRKVRTAVSARFESEGIETELSSFLDSILDQKLKVCQLIHEGRWEEKAREVVSHIAPEGELTIGDTAMTAIDLVAVDFVCQWEALSSISLVKVHANATFVDLLLSSLCAHHWDTLQELDLRENNIGDSGAAAIAHCLCKAGRESVRLGTLNISGNKIGDEGAKALGGMLVNNGNLQELYVGHNQIGGEGVMALVNAVKPNTGLRVLELNNSNASGSGAVVIGEMLQYNTCLQVLDLSKSRLRDGEVTALAAGLHSNTSLTELCLSGNKIGNTGAASLATILSHNTSLQKLDMSRNHIQYDGAQSIADMMATNTSLVQLSISNNNIGDAGAVAIVDMLCTKSSMVELDISSNTVQLDRRRELADVGEQNSHLHIRV